MHRAVGGDEDVREKRLESAERPMWHEEDNVLQTAGGKMIHRESPHATAVITFDDQMSPDDGGGLTSRVLQKEDAVSIDRRSKCLVAVYIGVAITSGVGLLGKISLLRSLLPLPTWALEFLIALSLALPLLWPIGLRFRKIVATTFLIGLAGVFLAVFPRIERLHSKARGSDQPDCIIAVSHSLVTAQWPYNRERLWSHNPLSCGPGWVALQTPAVQAVGYRWNLMVCWACAIAAIIGVVGWSSASAFLSLIALSPGLWLAASNGSDFLTFGIAIAALYLASERTEALRFVKVILLGLVAQFRFPTLLVPAFLRKQIGRAGVIWSSVLALGCQLIFLFWNPKSFIDDGPLHLFYKLTKSAALSTKPLVLSVEVILPLVFVILAVVISEEHTRSGWNLLVFLCGVFFVPAILDLVTKYHLYGTAPSALEFWEGGVWICGCLPLAAAMLVSERMIGLSETERDDRVWR
jgi:hypothetical protein